MRCLYLYTTMQSMIRLDPIRLKLLIPNSTDRRWNKTLYRSGVYAFCKKRKTRKITFNVKILHMTSICFSFFRLNPRDYVTLHSLVRLGFLMR